MAETKREKKKKPAKREIRERRFLPEQTQQSRASAVVGMIGSLVLGAGVYGQWVEEDPVSFAPQLVALGAAGLGAALWLGSTGLFPVRVGDAGIAIERGREMSRVAWFEIKKLTLDRGHLMVETAGTTLKISQSAHPKAVALAVDEAERRVPKVVSIPDDERKKLASVKETEGEKVPVDDVQVTGHRCAASEKVISFERDARICPTCGQVYHREHVPKTCVTCETDLAGKALSV